jgi:hypothetical protein
MPDDLQKPTPAPTSPDGAGVPRIQRPTGPSNAYDDLAQRIIREANDGAARRDPTPSRSSATPVDPSVAPDAGRFGTGGGAK